MTATKPSPRAPRRLRPTSNREDLRREFYRAVDDGGVSPREAVRMFRHMLGLTQREFAKFVGVAPRIVMAVEQGSANPTVNTLARLLKGSGVELRVCRKRRTPAS